MGWIKDLQQLSETVAKLPAAEMKSEMLSQIISVKGGIMEVQQQNAKLFQENKDLKAELEAATAAKTATENLDYEHNAYWPRGEVRGKIAYCPACLADKKKRIPLSKSDLDYGTFASCPSCKFKDYGVW